MTKKIIETFDLTKIYKLKGQEKEVSALNKINISIFEGEKFGLLGPNGAGKTTLIQILTSLKQPTSGYAILDGYNILKKPKQAKSNVALMLGSDMLYYRITGYDNLKFFCKIYNVPNYKEKIFKLAKEFGIEKWLNQYVENFSSGMKMKLALCRTLLLERKILFLDEPTLGMDVKSIDFIVKKLKILNNTIFLTSHNMNVVEKLCDRIGFINHGKLLKIGTKEDIQGFLETDIRIEIRISKNKDELKSELKKQEYLNQIIDNKNSIIVHLKKRENYKDLLTILSKYQILSIQDRDLSLEDMFLNII